MRGIIALVTIVLWVVCSMPCSAIAAPTSQQIASYEKRMNSYQEDLIQIGKGIRGGDVEITINLIDLAGRYSIELAHVQDLLLINSLVQDEADRRRIKPVTSARITAVATGVDLSIEQVNLSIAHLNSQAILATAIKLRDDLRALKELLLTSG